MKTNIILIAVVLLCFGGFGCVVYNRESNYEQVTDKEIHIVKNKQVIGKSTSNFGAFREEYKLLLETNEVQDVKLEEYMDCNIGDTIIISKTYLQEK